MFLLNLLDAQQPDYTPFIILGVFVIVIIVMTIYNNKQRKKQAAEEQKVRDSLCAGTTVITIGGIWGTVVSVNHEESTFVMESEGTKMKFDKRAIYKMTLPESVQKELAKQEKKEEPKA